MVVLDPLVTQAILGILGGLIWSIVYWAKNNADPTKFDWWDFTSTGIVGGALGFISVVFLGNPVSQAWIFAELGLYVGVDDGCRYHPEGHLELTSTQARLLVTKN